MGEKARTQHQRRANEGKQKRAAAAKKGKTVANNTEKTINKVKYEGYNYTPIEAQKKALDKIKQHQAREALCDRAVARAEEVIKAEDVRQKNTRPRSNSVPQARQTTRDRSNSVPQARQTT